MALHLNPVVVPHPSSTFPVILAGHPLLDRYPQCVTEGAGRVTQPLHMYGLVQVRTPSTIVFLVLSHCFAGQKCNVT